MTRRSKRDDGDAVVAQERLQIGQVSDGGLFHVKQRGWALVFEQDEMTIPAPGVRCGDTLAFVSPLGVAYTATIKGLGTVNKNGPRAVELWLDGEGSYLNEVEAGWPVYLSAWSR